MNAQEPQTQKSEISTSGNQTTELPAETVPSWLSHYLKSNPVSVAWQSALVIGGFILAIHFLHIGFFPDLDWQASLALLAIVALTGIFIWVFICFTLVFPSFIWLIFLEDIEESNLEQSNIPAITDTSDKQVLDHDKPSNQTEGQKEDVNPQPTQKAASSKQVEPKWWGGFLLFGLPTLVFWILINGIIWINPDSVNANFGWTILGFVITVGLLGGLIYRLTDKERLLGTRFRSLRWWRYLFAVQAGSIIFFAPVSLIYILVYSKYNSSPFRLWTVVLAVLFAFLYNVAVLTRSLRGTGRGTTFAGFLEALSVGAILSIGIVGATGNWVLIPEGVASLYGIGNLDGATLLLKKEGCDIARGLSLNIDQTSQGVDLCRMRRVNILNRLGSTYYIESLEGARFTIPVTAISSYELPVSSPLNVQVNLKEEGEGYNSGQVIITNTANRKIIDVWVVIEFRDESNKQLQSQWVYFDSIDGNQKQERDFSLVPAVPKSAVKWDLIITHNNRKIPYNLINPPK